MEKEISVVKRRSRGREPLNIEKIHEMVEYAVEGITGVSSSQVEMSSGYNSLMVLLLMKYNRY